MKTCPRSIAALPLAPPVCTGLAGLLVLASLAHAQPAATEAGHTASRSLPAGTLLSASLLEHQNATIGDIRLEVGNIFDLDNPEEDRKLHQWANALHITTRPDVIRSQLLFQTGDPYSAQTVDESERLLRSNRYLQEAEIVPVSYSEGVVDLEVRTTDTWTLTPSVSLGRSGGKNSAGFGLKEHNLLGRGTSITAAYKSNVDRDSVSFGYFDKNLFSSRYQLGLEYADTSDGFNRHFGLEQPFFALDARHAGGVNLHDGQLTESLYDRGEIVSDYQHRFATHEAYFGWSKGLQGGWTRRYVSGIGYDAHEFGPAPDDVATGTLIPEDRRFVFPFAGVEWLQDDFDTTRNLDHMNRTEDRYLGRKLSFRLGYAGTGLGSTANAWLYQGYVGDTLIHGDGNTLSVQASWQGRIEEGVSRNATLSIGGRYDRRQSDKRLFHARLAGSWGNRLDIDNPMYIGGDNGLRGYPLRYQSGDRSLLLTLEERVFTDWYPWRLFNIGGAVFFDAGRTWGENPVGGENLGWLRDVGFGLRIGSTRSGEGKMIHIDVAFPLDGEADISNVQFLVETKKGF